MGRPSKFSEATVAEICARLANGEPLAQICRDPKMPGVTTVWDWEKAHPGVSESIARAREAGEEAIGAECLTIVDNTEEDPASRRVRADTRLKLLAKWNPRKWGDRLQHANDPNDPMPAPQFIVQHVVPRE